MEKLNKILNDNYESKNRFSKNYFWIGTVVVVVVCALLFLIGGNGVFFGIQPLNILGVFTIDLQGILNNFGHTNLQHMLLNMLCFFVVGIYFERRIGTFKLLILIVSIASLNYIHDTNGFSLVNYALYFFIFIDYLFLLFQKTKRTKQTVILGMIILALIYFAMCFNGGTTGFGFEWYPYDLFYNHWHVQGALFGICIGLLIQIWGLGIKAKLNTQ